ncbi:bifunctional riboflavin kinase/FMN adenylyltransferase [Mycoavidus cysteinexigens]|uniref:Riboflavin biosynthesis protein n=1 Tax=Mycoavidus cysteinexigens TaxID=1553431 RepID=A0A2Z6EXJ7_9BURK|nr:bifunctional riboflavin kinase/FAD synthetase [Mycoavidus cysteinexigens]BBE10189.1 bifunctional riboflavin kinase/FMN adenylyltransferase [Mycoavidus cysteinexigens]GLR00606.1 riboflavin biosynthesis protein [Mycoavidus cysteinexigens]
MRVFRGLSNARNPAPCALTIGNFDGVHRGHQMLLARLREQAKQRGLPVCVMTFEPHPREFFNPASAPPRIALLRDKLEALSLYGVDQVLVEPFNATFASQTADAFIQQIIVQGLNTRWLLVGDDFRYGAKRAGDFAALQTASKQYRFEVEQIATLTNGSQRISSSAIRAALLAGDLALARVLLGRSYMMSGHVIHGNKLGRELGFPTLNLRVAPQHLALSGIFAVAVHGLAQNPLPAVASLGIRPTVDNSGRILLETHILDWQGDAYGKLLRIEFLKKLRGEEKYNDLATLRTAIARDVENARAFFISSDYHYEQPEN